VLVLQRLLGAILALGLLAAALIFASIVLAVMFGVALVVGAWLWWRTRAIRREMSRNAPSTIEGEFREVPSSRIEDKR
jgi:membrane protein implicated in regulation of membrane protease activity